MAHFPAVASRRNGAILPAMASPIVLFGGSSGERRVSVATAQNVLTVLPQAVPWFASADLKIYRPPREEVLQHQQPFTTEFAPKGPPAAASLDEAVGAAEPGAVFFLALHGDWGEDGTVQKLLEARGLAFTGSGSKASAAAFDKAVAKELARKKGLRVADSLLLPTGVNHIEAALGGQLARHGRVVAKPLAGGSSVGLHHVHTQDEARKAAAEIARSGQPYLCEEFISGRELTIGVVEGPRGRRALPPSEVQIDQGRAFDYEGKYLGKGTVEITPAEVSPAITAAVQAMALTAHEAIGCYGYSRTDVIIDQRGPCFLETNTLPGLTKASFIPQQLAAEGTPIAAFLEEQLELARKRASGSGLPA